MAEEGWRQKSGQSQGQSQESWSEGEGGPFDEDCHRVKKVKPCTHRSRSRSRSPEGHKEKEKDKERRHKHKHKKHKMKKRSRSRSRSKSSERERRRSRSRDKERRHGKHDRREESFRNERRSPKDERDRSRRPDSNSWYRERGQRDRQGRDNYRKDGGVSNQSSQEDELDLEKTAQPFSSGYIPAAATKLKAEIEKRKALFLNKKDKPPEAASTSTLWKQTAFSDDSGGQMQAKFKRLMGIKDEAPSSSGKAVDKSDSQRDDYFANLEKQYEVARATTHTQRGLGLGFSSRVLPR